MKALLIQPYASHIFKTVQLGQAVQPAQPAAPTQTPTNVKASIPEGLTAIPAIGLTWGDVQKGDYIYFKDLVHGYEDLVLVTQAETTVKIQEVASNNPSARIGAVETITEQDKKREPMGKGEPETQSVTVYRKSEAVAAQGWIWPVVAGLGIIGAILIATRD